MLNNKMSNHQMLKKSFKKGKLVQYKAMYKIDKEEPQ